MSAPDCAPGLSIGTRGSFDGVNVEVLGWARLQNHHGESFHEVVLRTEDAKWWTLEFDRNHIMLHRELKHKPLDTPEGIADGSTVTLDTKRKAYPYEKVTLHQVEGEYWKDMERGDASVVRPFFGGSTVVTAQKDLGDDDEPWTWSEGVYLDKKDVETAFEVELAKPARSDLHPARPYPYTPLMRWLGWGFLAGLVGSAIAAFMMPAGGGEVLFEDTVALTPGEGELFVGMLDSTEGQTVGIRFQTEGLLNTWANVTLVLTDTPGDGVTPEQFEAANLVKVTTELSRYEGYDEGYWVEDDQKKTEGFRINSGSYGVLLGWEMDPIQRSDVPFKVTIQKGYTNPLPLYGWMAFCALGGLIWLLVRSGHRKRVLVEYELADDD